ncbi:MAG TPA: hypothetical protein DIT35_07945, partial [Rhodospirillaceae bacterium]|nr:hypothetical protein [Rhodospirillaceae bacterium]
GRGVNARMPTRPAHRPVKVSAVRMKMHKVGTFDSTELVPQPKYAGHAAGPNWAPFCSPWGNMAKVFKF